MYRFKNVRLMFTVAFVLSIMGSSFIVSAAEPTDRRNNNMIAPTQDIVRSVEENFSSQGTSVEREMNELINVFQAKQRDCKDIETQQQFQDLIDTANALLSDYENYKNSSIYPSATRSPSPATNVGVAAYEE